MTHSRIRTLRSPLRTLSLCLALGLTIVPAARLTAAAAMTMATDDEKQEFTIKATDQGFEPSTITLKKGVPARLTFVRTSDKSCATEVVIPDLKVKKELPLNANVAIQFTPQEAKELSFTCGAQMFKGKLVVE